MSWWGWPTRFRAAQETDAADLSAPEPIHDQPRRLRAPNGTQAWICQTVAGDKFAFDREQEANNRAATSKGAVVYPVTIELDTAEEQIA